MTGELERQTGEQRSELNHFRTDALHRLSSIENKNQANMLQVRDMIEGNRSALNGYIDRLDSKFTGMINKATEGWSNMMVISKNFRYRGRGRGMGRGGGVKRIIIISK